MLPLPISSFVYQRNSDTIVKVKKLQKTGNIFLYSTVMSQSAKQLINNHTLLNF